MGVDEFALDLRNCVDDFMDFVEATKFESSAWNEFIAVRTDGSRFKIIVEEA